MSNKFKIMLLSITLLLVCSMLIGTSYSVWRLNYVQEGTNEVTVGCFSITFTNLNSYGGNEAGDINLVNTYPITETAGSALTPYVFKIENTCSVAASYSVNLETLSTSTFNTDYLRIKLDDATSSIYKDITEGVPTIENALSAKQLTTGVLSANEEVTYAIRAWIDIDATTETPNVMGETWNGKVVVTSEAAPEPLPYTVVSGDLDTVGSVVKIANEEFYVIGQEDSSHVKLLSKWNLNVGNNNPQPGEIGIQNSKAIGWNSDSSTKVNSSYPAATLFSWTVYWYDEDEGKLNPGYGNTFPTYVYDNNSNLYQYVDNYVTYLTNQGVNVSGRLISYEEMLSLGCNAATEHCDSSNGGTAPEWVYQTSYFSGTAVDDFNDYYLWCIRSNGYFIGDSHWGDELYYGVRPVIILEK